MSFEEIKNLLTATFGPDVITNVTEGEQPQLHILPAALAKVCKELHENEQTYFDFLACVTGLDNGPETGTLEVVYNLYSIPYEHSLVLKVTIPRNQPEKPLPVVPSVSHIWRTADWHEREIYDLVGIHFQGHPDLRRILLPADWTGHPLRKDYQDLEYYHNIRVPYEKHNEDNGFKGERDQKW